MFSTRFKGRLLNTWRGLWLDRSVSVAALWLVLGCLPALIGSHDLPVDGIPTTPAYAIALAQEEWSQEDPRSPDEGYIPGPGVTDDPSTWPDKWGDAPRRAQGCSNASFDKGGEHGRGGSLAHPTNCRCTNRCVEKGLVPGARAFARNHGDPRCKVTCRNSTCKCKPRCRELS